MVNRRRFFGLVAGALTAKALPTRETQGTVFLPSLGRSVRISDRADVHKPGCDGWHTVNVTFAIDGNELARSIVPHVPGVCETWKVGA